MFRNKISETRRSDCLCNGLTTPDDEHKLQLVRTEEPGFQKALDLHGYLRNLRRRSRQRSNLDDEHFYRVPIFDFADVDAGVALILSVHTSRRCSS